MARNPDRKEDRVIFKVIRGEVNAFMPDSEANPGMILCYAHLGQHSEASMDYYRLGRPAKPHEYQELKDELGRIGYRVKVAHRI
jgi:hypothetical protein